jgi:hypothetical protein
MKGRNRTGLTLLASARKIQIYLAPEEYDELERRSLANERSLNAEVRYCLKQWWKLHPFKDQD